MTLGDNIEVLDSMGMLKNLDALFWLSALRTKFPLSSPSRLNVITIPLNIRLNIGRSRQDAATSDSGIVDCPH